MVQTTVDRQDPEPLPAKLARKASANAWLAALILAALVMGLAPIPFASLGSAALLVVAVRR